MMLTFRDFLKMMAEELWYTSGPQDNPSNPGTKRKNPTNWLNKRYGQSTGATMGSGGGPVNVPVQPAPGGGGGAPPPPPPPKRMKKR